MAKKFKKELLQTLETGQTVSVQIAHEYSRGYYSSYSNHKYIIEAISQKKIIGRNIEHNRELISITRKDIDSCRFILQ